MIYAFVHLKVSDTAKLGAYREKAAAALARHGGEVLAASPEPTMLEGNLPAPDIAAVLGFPDRDAALKWMGDADLAEVHALRRASGDSSIILVG